jgi:hypothetical protein
MQKHSLTRNAFIKELGVSAERPPIRLVVVDERIGDLP